MAKRAGVPVYTIALGTPDGVLDLQALGAGQGTVPVPPDPDALRAIARETGGESFTALDQGTLKKVYDHIGTRVSSTKEQKEVTFVLAGVGSGPAARRDGLLLGTAEHLMTFADPYLLAALVLVPLAVIVYVVLRPAQPPCCARRREPGAVAEPDAAPSRLAAPRAARAAAAGPRPAARRRGAAAGA